MGTILLIILILAFFVRCEMNGENGWAKIIETAVGIGVMILAFCLGASVLMMIVSFIASL